MERPHARSPQRVDLLDNNCKKAGDQEGTHRKIEC